MKKKRYWFFLLWIGVSLLGMTAAAAEKETPSAAEVLNRTIARLEAAGQEQEALLTGVRGQFSFELRLGSKTQQTLRPLFATVTNRSFRERMEGAGSFRLQTSEENGVPVFRLFCEASSVLGSTVITINKDEVTCFLPNQGVILKENWNTIRAAVPGGWKPSGSLKVSSLLTLAAANLRTKTTELAQTATLTTFQQAGRDCYRLQFNDSQKGVSLLEVDGTTYEPLRVQWRTAETEKVEADITLFFQPKKDEAQAFRYFPTSVNLSASSGEDLLGLKVEEIDFQSTFVPEDFQMKTYSLSEFLGLLLLRAPAGR